jgi:catechol 2,3-dioxygenase-like lactoylglutathione lyase family enzyme
LSARSYNHIAFQIDDQDFDVRRTALQDLGLEYTEGRPRVAGEGRSLYFHTPDNHLIELHTGTLETRLARYAKGQNPE